MRYIVIITMVEEGQGIVDQQVSTYSMNARDRLIGWLGKIAQTTHMEYSEYERRKRNIIDRIGWGIPDGERVEFKIGSEYGTVTMYYQEFKVCE